MGRGITPQSFVEVFCARVDSLAQESGRSNAELAQEMGVEVDTFRRYRKRLLMPHHLIHRFCDIMDVKADFLLRDAPITIEARVVKTREPKKPARIGKSA